MNIAPMSSLKGTEPWKTRAGVSFTIWDLWFLALLESPGMPSWGSVVSTLKDPSRRSGSRQDTEAKLSHLEDLRARLARAGSSPSDLAGEDTRGRKVQEWALRRILQEQVRERDMSEAMRNPPGERLYARALRGQWDEFPVSPAEYESIFHVMSQSAKSYGEKASFGLVERMEKKLDRACAGAKGSSSRLLAIHRAFLTAMIDLIERADDSFGALGQSFGDRFEAYVRLPWEADISATAYYADVLEFVTWEDYGWTDDYHSLLLRRVPPEHRPLARSILDSLKRELLGSHLDYQAKTVAKLLTLLPKTRPPALPENAPLKLRRPRHP